MTAYGTEFFSMNDVNRLRILQDVIDRRLTKRLAANRLEISDRHCRRLLERYREHGPLSLVNRRRGQPGNRQLMPGFAERALHIIRERYGDFGPTLACEMLAEIWPKRQYVTRICQSFAQDIGASIHWQNSSLARFIQFQQTVNTVDPFVIPRGGPTVSELEKVSENRIVGIAWPLPATRQ